MEQRSVYFKIICAGVRAIFANICTLRQASFLTYSREIGICIRKVDRNVFHKLN